MKANVLFGIDDLRYLEIDKPVLKHDEVLLKMKASGICGSDIARVFVTGTYHFPIIMGHEFSGEIIEVFSCDDTHLIGKRVSVFPLIPCMQCNLCKQGNYEMCSDYNYLGSRCNGGFAEYVAVPKWNLAFIPDNVSYEEAAMLEPAAVAMHALKRMKFEIGNSVVIVGPGTVGIILAQLLQLAGASKVVLIGRSHSKLDFAQKLGIEYTCNSNQVNVLDYIMNLTNGHGVDIAVEGTGIGASMNHCFDITRPSGMILALGNPQEDIWLDKHSYWKLLRKQQEIRGTWNSSFGTNKSDWDIIIDLLKGKKLMLKELITHRLPLSDLNKGLKIMRDNSIYSNKVMIINE